MSAAARLTTLEGALSPKAATLAWLAEAHAFPTLAAYVGWLTEQPPEAAPLWRVPEQAERAVRASLRGQPRDVVEAAAHQAVRDAVFLVELVIRLNVEATELLRVAGLRHAALAWEGQAISAAAERETGTQSRRTVTRRQAVWREAVSDWQADLDVAAAARGLLERRYLDGRDVLFPDLGRQWHTLRDTTGRLAPAPRGPVRGRRAEADAARLVDTVRAVVLDRLGDTDRAAAIGRRHLVGRGR